MDLLQLLVAAEEMRKRAVRKNVFFLSVMRSMPGSEKSTTGDVETV